MRCILLSTKFQPDHMCKVQKERIKIEEIMSYANYKV